jgi:hypothetical protein
MSSTKHAYAGWKEMRRLVLLMAANMMPDVRDLFEIKPKDLNPAQRARMCQSFIRMIFDSSARDEVFPGIQDFTEIYKFETVELGTALLAVLQVKLAKAKEKEEAEEKGKAKEKELAEE